MSLIQAQLCTFYINYMKTIERNVYMKSKQILCGIAAATMCLSLVGCGNKTATPTEPDVDVKESTTPESTPGDETQKGPTLYVPVEPEKADPKYDADPLSISSFVDRYSYGDKTAKKFIKNINGNIIDTYQSGMFYALTDVGIYFCSWNGDSHHLAFDPGENVHIEHVGYHNIVLSDANGKITIFKEKEDGTYQSFTDDALVAGENDIVLVRHGIGSIDESVFIIKEITKDGITATVAGDFYKEDGSSEFKVSSVDEKFSFTTELTSEIKEILFDDVNSTSGMLLLENGELYPFDLGFDAYSDGGVKIGDKIDDDVSAITYYTGKNYIRYIKNSDKANIYIYSKSYDYDSDTVSINRGLAAIPNGYSTDNITKILPHVGYIQIDGSKWYKPTHNETAYTYDANMTEEAFVEKYSSTINLSESTLMISDGVVVKLLSNLWWEIESDKVQHHIDNHHVVDDWFLMDDGYIYEYISQ